jgi:hypothetical protein
VILRLAADAVLVIHLAFIAFVLFGGVLVLRRRIWAAFHLPAVAWGAFAELSGTICPLTPLENSLRRSAGAAGTTAASSSITLFRSFIRPGSRRASRSVLGLVVLAVNVPVYALAWRKRRMTRAGISVRFGIGIVPVAAAVDREWAFLIRPRNPCIASRTARLCHDPLPDRRRRSCRMSAFASS